MSLILLLNHHPCPITLQKKQAHTQSGGLGVGLKKPLPRVSLKEDLGQVSV